MEPIPEAVRNIAGSDATVLYHNASGPLLLQTGSGLLLAGTKAAVTNGITRFLKGGLLETFRFVRSLYHTAAATDMLLDTLRSTRENIAAVLEDHYGPATYSEHISAFDEYLESMHDRYHITITDQQVAHHAGVASVDDLPAAGYRNRHWYLLNEVSYEERERMLVENGGFTYKEWLEKEIDRFMADPALLIREYDCVFENIFPNTVQIDTDAFCEHITAHELPVLVLLVFGKKTEYGTVPDGDADMVYVKGIPREYEAYWE